MVQTLSRELILPALRLDVPTRPTREHLSLLADRSADEWSLDVRSWTTQQVVRLAVAEVLLARLGQADPERLERGGVSPDPEQATLGGLSSLFRPHVDLLVQAFRVAVVEAVNAGVPAAADPMREGLRRAGVTGRDAVRMIALGLDKVPARARSDFWRAARGSVGVTAVVDAIAGASSAHDVTTLDRSHLSRADALVQAGGRTLAVAIGQRAREDGGSWLRVPVGVVRSGSAPGAGPAPQPGAGVEVSLRGDGWVEVFETALDAVTTAMQTLDLGSRPKGRPAGPAAALADRLAAAKDRTVADVVASLRAVHPLVAEIYGHQIAVGVVRVAVPVVEDDQLMQLWLPTSALAGPLFVGAADLFLGAASDVRQPGGRGAGGRAAGGRGEQRPRGQQPRPAPKAGPKTGPTGGPTGGPGAPVTPAAETSEPGRPKRRRGGRGRRPPGETGTPASPTAEPNVASVEPAPAAPPPTPPSPPAD